MKRTSIRRAVVPGVAALALALTACGGGNSADASDDSGDTGSSEASSDFADLSGELAIGGASSQESAQNAWIVGFGEAAPGVTVTYDPVGSGGGRENFISGGYPMAGSDSYLNDDEGELSAATETCGAEPIEIPNYVSPIAIIFNVEGVDELNLAPETLAGIFAGTITKWNDDAIVADNPDATLPDETITPVHLRPRPRDLRGRRLPDRPDLLHPRLPELRRRGHRGQRQGLHLLHPQRRGPGDRVRRGGLRPADRRDPREGPGHRRPDLGRLSTNQHQRRGSGRTGPAPADTLSPGGTE